MSFKLEHIGIAVSDLKEAISIYENLLNTNCYKTEEVESQKTKTAFLKTENTKIELLEATHKDSTIHKFIEKKGEGIHHIAFEVDDLETEIERLKKEGFRLIYKEPQQGADGKRITFLHPKDTNGVLIELCEGG